MLRFAPSPNGPLHKGHALSALANERMAAATGHPLTVRMEDIDQTRSRPEHEASILRDLNWLGIEWTPPMRRQSEHFSLYESLAERLRRADLLYPSFATRREIAEAALAQRLPRDPDGAPVFSGDPAIIGEAEAARRARSHAPTAWRLRMARALAATGPLDFVEVDDVGGAPERIAADPLAWGDVVLARKETPTSYHLSVVADDAVQGVTHVVRGRDLFAATAVHRVLQALLDLPAPRYHHHALLMGPDGRKLSKSNGGQSLGDLRASGLSANDLRRQLGYERVLR